jgi:hypothetical protein
MDKNITPENIDEVKSVILEYMAHDREAFETRTEMFRIMMQLANKLEESWSGDSANKTF